MPKLVDSTLRINTLQCLSGMGSHLRSGAVADAEALLIQAWDGLPVPQHEWDMGQLVILHAISFYLKTGRPEEAKKWLHPLAISFGSADDGTVAMITGTVHYEAHDFDAAFERFNHIYVEFGKRPFQGRDKKYLEFYLSKAKSKSI